MIVISSIKRFSKYLITISSVINPLDYIAENVLPAIWKERQWIRCLYTTNIDPNFEDFIVSTYTKRGASNIVPKRRTIQSLK